MDRVITVAAMSGALALVRGILEGWFPRSAAWVGLVAGPLVLLGYLVGSVPFGYLSSRRRLRRQLADPALAGETSSHRAGLHVPGSLGVVVSSALATLVVTTLAWDVALAATPGSNTFSAVGVFSNQVIGAWVSVALWTGAAAVAGQVAPVWTRFRGGGSGLVPAVALAGVYAPMVLAAGVSAAVVVYAVGRRTPRCVLPGAVAAVAFEYLAWVADLQGGWGVTNGPELALWTTVLASILAAGTVSAEGEDTAAR